MNDIQCSKPHEMEMQVSCRVDSEIPAAVMMSVWVILKKASQ